MKTELERIAAQWATIKTAEFEINAQREILNAPEDSESNPLLRKQQTAKEIEQQNKIITRAMIEAAPDLYYLFYVSERDINQSLHLLVDRNDPDATVANMLNDFTRLSILWQKPTSASQGNLAAVYGLFPNISWSNNLETKDFYGLPDYTLAALTTTPDVISENTAQKRMLLCKLVHLLTAADSNRANYNEIIGLCKKLDISLPAPREDKMTITEKISWVQYLLEKAGFEADSSLVRTLTFLITTGTELGSAGITTLITYLAATPWLFSAALAREQYLVYLLSELPTGGRLSNEISTTGNTAAEDLYRSQRVITSVLAGLIGFMLARALLMIQLRVTRYRFDDIPTTTRESGLPPQWHDVDKDPETLAEEMIMGNITQQQLIYLSPGDRAALNTATQTLINKANIMEESEKKEAILLNAQTIQDALAALDASTEEFSLTNPQAKRLIDAVPAIIKAAHFPIAYTAGTADTDVPCFENAVQEIRATALTMKKQSLADLAAQVAKAMAELTVANSVSLTPEIRANLLAAAEALLNNANSIAEGQKEVFTLNAVLIKDSLAALDSDTAEFAADNANIQSLLNAVFAVAEASKLPFTYLAGATTAQMIAFEEAVAALDHCVLEMQQKNLINHAAKTLQAIQALFAVATFAPETQRALIDAALAIEGIATDQIPLETTTKQAVLLAAAKQIADALKSGLITAVRKRNNSQIIPLQAALDVYEQAIAVLKDNPEASNNLLLTRATTAINALCGLITLNPPSPQLTAPVENLDMRTLDALNAPASSSSTPLVQKNGYTEIPSSASAQFNAQARPTVFAQINYDPTQTKNALNMMEARKTKASTTPTIKSTPFNPGGL